MVKFLFREPHGRNMITLAHVDKKTLKQKHCWGKTKTLVRHVTPVVEILEAMLHHSHQTLRQRYVEKSTCGLEWNYTTKCYFFLEHTQINGMDIFLAENNFACFADDFTRNRCILRSTDNRFCTQLLTNVFVRCFKINFTFDRMPTSILLRFISFKCLN